MEQLAWGTWMSCSYDLTHMFQSISLYIEENIVWLTLLILNSLTHWSRVTHICVSKLTTIGSDNGLSPGRRQAIIWINDGILLIQTLGTNFSEILSEIHSFSFKEMHLKMSSAKWRLFHLGLNELMRRLCTDLPSCITKLASATILTLLGFRYLPSISKVYLSLIHRRPRLELFSGAQQQKCS